MSKSEKKGKTTTKKYKGSKTKAIRDDTIEKKRKKTSNSKTERKKIPSNLKTERNKKTSSKSKTESKEIWKKFPHKLFRDKFKVSNYGRIKKIATNTIVKQKKKNGYLYFHTSHKNKDYSFRAHKIIATVFVENPDEEKNNIVNHLDGDKLNNHYKNLEWTTIKKNNQHAADNGLVKKTKRRVSQYDLNNNFIKTYDTLTQAYQETGISSGSIVGVCKGVCKKAGGFIWKYTDENPNEVVLDPKEAGFKQVKTFPNYWISKDGRIYSKPFKKFMKLNKHRTGCLQVQFTRKKEGGGQIRKTILVHNLVGSYFLKKPKNQKVNYVGHKDGNRTNNNVNNLEWRYLNGVNANLEI